MSQNSVKSSMPRWPALFHGALAIALLCLNSYAQPASDAPPPVPAEEQPEVLTSGPVHEAFAQPVELQSEAAVVAPTAPPANIEEEPPAERPQGDNYVWVPGYWSWDTDRKSYIWVSACWRVAPDNMSWVPGYWNQTDDGYEWVAGFWTASGAKEMEYLPAPPAVEDVAPPGEPPNADQVWVPPCQYWTDGRYVLRRGYWLTPQAGWVWTPSHYVWTPHGYVFCAGHWDYPLERRGVLFAPVYFPRPIYTRVGFTYSPSIVVDIGDLSVNLFTCPRYRHYYFGDYYDAGYEQEGIYPRFEVDRIHTWYDPIYVHDRWEHRRSDPQWEAHERHDFEVRRDDKNLRPARTYREQETRLARLPEAQRKNVRVAETYKTVVSSKTTSMKFEQVSTEARKKIQTQAADVHKFRDDRRTWEAPARGKTETTGRETPAVREPSRENTARPRTNEPAVKPEERRTTPPDRTVTPKPEERRTPPAEERRKPGTEERRTTGERTPAVVPARDVHRTEPERVKIPTPSVSGKSHDTGGGAERTPSQPTGEHQSRDSGTGRDDTRGRGK